MITTEYIVEGMTCGHCAQAVTSELKNLSGVVDVRVTVESGVVQVDSNAALDRSQVAAAIDEAGYSLVSQ